MNQEDVSYMRLAIEEARKGTGRTSPNPCVGAIIVRDGTIVGRGYHRKAGTPHAEVNAIADAGEYAIGATLYVTLEPCNHTGRTPPCTKAVLDAELSRVVIGMLDPNPSVAGGGCEFLEANGVKVETGLLEDECRAINRPFIKHSTTGLPWIVMKAGMSLDGKISYTMGQGGRITGEQSTRFTHTLRNTLDAILIGAGTAQIDNPSLTTRLPDTDDTRDPVRIILDTQLKIEPEAVMLQQQSSASTIIFSGPDASAEKRSILEEAGAKICTVGFYRDNRLDLTAVLNDVGSLGISSVLVEGGATVHASLLDQQLADEVYLFTAPMFIGEKGTPLLSGVSVPDANDSIRLKDVDCRKLGDDILIHGFFDWND